MSKWQLCLIAKKEVKFKDGEIKIKHLFIDSNEKAFIGWTSVEEQESDANVVASGKFEEARARAYDVDVDEYESKLRYRVKM